MAGKNLSFYRAMHFSAKRGLAIACRLSIRPSVTLVDQDHQGHREFPIGNSRESTAPRIPAGIPGNY